MSRNDARNPEPERTYRGQPAEARRAQRRGRLIDAAIDFMTDGEWRLVTVEKLCAAAGLNKRYFYESFDGLDAVAAAAIDDIAERVQVAALAALAETAADPVERQAHAAAAAVVRTLTDDPRRARVLLGGVAVGSTAHHLHRARVIRRLTAVLVGHARSVHDVRLESDPLAQLAPAFMIGGTADAILAFIEGRAVVTHDELVDSLATLWLLTGNGAVDLAQQRAAAHPD
ncbi:TetR/AcrR family transcriptional regulator [[Mycobacterium] wendilense]|uniref:TetR/AcrR family transcriptional regulator n=1 Tax=[Mycobacterium] wendilense TaxID=3064284 RepID=A0ABN9PBZ6_9MYCO|nr:TetR/AcrR family transcriptional regulator [Mycolicibacterium sp. MU0050]CAJ1587048.1 TetR/AcrR family transcriptional regulator [Mycolicibacterium sp. MU0050]